MPQVENNKETLYLHSSVTLKMHYKICHKIKNMALVSGKKILFALRY